MKKVTLYRLAITRQPERDDAERDLLSAQDDIVEASVEYGRSELRALKAARAARKDENVLSVEVDEVEIDTSGGKLELLLDMLAGDPRRDPKVIATLYSFQADRGA